MPSKPLVKAKPLAQQQKKPIVGKANQEIRLQSPNSDNHAAFVIGNAQFCDRVVEENSRAGKHLVLCGAGPSLADHAAEWCPQADEVWGCNSALTWLYDNGHKVTAGLCIDQQPEMVAEWYSAPPVEYIVASTIHPHLTEHLLSKGRNLTWFHNFVGMRRRPVAYGFCHDCGADGSYEAVTCGACGSTNVERLQMDYESYMYCTLYPGTVRAGSGLNAATRAIDVARFMGFSRITVLGADCALRIKSRPPQDVAPGSPEHMAWLREETVMHADGGSALASNATPVTLGGEIDAGTVDEEIREGHGEWWETKPDLIISAVWLEQMRRKCPEIELVGNTLPNALRLKSNAYLSRLPHMTDSAGKPVEFQREDAT